ncbi:MAG: hypothetical protein FJ221_00955 [Lentisphaerae bacterium]|nr:hypothetical protein [Lentisphaerota bacterium]
MKRIEFWLRIAAYACGLAGVALVWTADAASRLRTAGFLLMVVMFVLFSAAHILRLTVQLRSVHRPLRTVDPWGGGRGRGADPRGSPPGPRDPSRPDG